MRSFLVIVFLAPFLANTQINRSARELASERVEEYVTTKLFKDLSYKPIAFGEIKSFDGKKNRDIYWTIEHKFEVTDKHKSFDQKPASTKEYKFLFYLDDKMKVLRADSYFVY